ncbi:hypothetical protein KY320_00680 [Candidatus Woesearchaeota archaeon]|nr:hypothetical protein [Candidatus Woesearchaeota archaeon]
MAYGRVALLIIWTCLITECVLAYSVESYAARYDVVDSYVRVAESVVLSSTAEEYVIELPQDAYDVEAGEAQIEDNIVRFSEISNFEIGYSTKSVLDRESFLLDFVAPADIKKLDIMLILPEGYTLEEALGDEKGSIYPKPDSATTDGNVMEFSWGRSGLKQGDELPIYVMFKVRQSVFAYVVLVAFMLVLAIFVSLYTAKKPKQSVVGLKEDEEMIVNVLQQREGKMCEQGTLRVITGWPKSSLSKLLTELEERGVIHREKRGKKNLVFLKK